MMSTVQITKVAPLTLADYAEMPYSPALLLDSKIDASITDDLKFRKGCEDGFEMYFGYRVLDEAGSCLVEGQESYSWDVVVAFLTNNVLDEEGGCRPWRIGCLLGWLSAYALFERAMARRALVVLEALLVSSEWLRRGLAA
jgi:hypothetical protein